MEIINTIEAIIILDVEGQRILAKNFSNKTNCKQFEKKIFSRTKSPKSRDEIFSIDGMLIIHKFASNQHIYVIGDKNGNPVILDSISKCLVEVMSSLLTTKPDERPQIREHSSQVVLAVDEICENGIILETDPNLVLQRVLFKDEIVEQSMAQKLQSATELIKFPWSRS